MTSSQASIAIMVALEHELPANKLPGERIVYSGVGKVNASLAAMELITADKPDLIINFGTAGALSPDMEGLVEVGHFIQRDMDASALGFALGTTPFDEIADIRFGDSPLTCGTGDNFITEKPAIVTDLVDMESYAIAKACLRHGVDFRSMKFVSDQADADAATDWQENIASGADLFCRWFHDTYRKGDTC